MSRRARMSGFTLVELLVVLAIISVLISMLVPSLTAAKQLSKEIGCRVNQNTLIKGCNLYAGDYDGHLPWPNWGTGSSEVGWAHKGTISAVATNLRHRLVETGQIWPYVRQIDAYHCPLDPPPWPGNQASRWVTTYSMNGSVICYGKHRTTTHKLENFRSDAILLWETDDTSGWWNDCANYPREGITKRHREGATVSCVGGYTDFLTHTAYYQEEQRCPGRLWNAPCLPRGR